MEKAVLAYSGGLDTSVTIRWLSDQGYEVHAVAVDVGQREDFGEIVDRGEQAGAASVRVVDAVDRYAAEFLAPAIKANGLYEGKYPMVSGLARPCIVEEVVTVAREIDASTVAHGCTGKGNDQVRFEVGSACWRRTSQVLAPIRDANIPREKAIGLAAEWGIPIASLVKTYSVDENLWGRTAECGPLEDPWVAPARSKNPVELLSARNAAGSRPRSAARAAVAPSTKAPAGSSAEPAPPSVPSVSAASAAMPDVPASCDGERQRVFLVRPAAALAADRHREFAARQDHGAAAGGLQFARQPACSAATSRASPSSRSPRKTHS